MTGRDAKKYQHDSSRLVEVSKLANSRVGVGLINRGREVAVAQVAATSPLEGLVFPGDIIRISQECSRNALTEVLNSARTMDAHALSSAFHSASHLALSVQTPAHLAGARSVFILSSSSDTAAGLGIAVEKDRETGRARVASLAPGSIAATRLDRDTLAPGDLIVAISEGGTLYDVPSPKEAIALLKLPESGAIELRVVRPSDSDGVGEPMCRAAASRPGSARPAAVNERLTADMFAAPPAYTTV